MTDAPRRDPTASAVIEDLVLRAARGDRDAQEALLTRYRYFIRRAVRARLGPALRGRESTSDLEQEVAIEVLRSLARHEWRGHSAFVAWLRRLAADEVIDAARYHAAQRRDPGRETPADERLAGRPRASPESWLDEARRMHELEQLLDTLPDQQAQAVVLFYQGHSHAEIGAVLGTSAEAARKHVARGRAKLASLTRR